MIRIFSLIVLGVLLATSPSLASSKKGISKQHDSAKPIEINADNLEVDQIRQTAIFSGKVAAVQGNIRLYADKMVVYYRGNQKENPVPAASPMGTSSPSSISKVEVDGNVVIKTLEETARGNQGVYDVTTSSIQLNGNVTLMQGANIIQGDALVYNLDTGKSKVSSNHATPSETSKDAKRKGRVKSVFVPTKQ